MRILVSACLLGLNTRYDGLNSLHGEVLRLADKHILIPVCPEQLGGLTTPRTQCEIRGGRVIDKNGRDMTEAFQSGAEQALAVYQLCGCSAAVLKRYSPSCGKGLVYDGTFQGKLQQGSGLFADTLLSAGVSIYGEDEANQIDNAEPAAASGIEIQAVGIDQQKAKRM